MKSNLFSKWLLVVTVLFIGFSSANLAHARTGVVHLNGYNLEDDQGKFLGLGASYFYALGDYLNANSRFRDNIQFLSEQGFNYIRIFSMVNWESYGKVINPDPNYIPNYNQELASMIDLVYSLSGQKMRTQITIFASADSLMPGNGSAARWNHINNILAVVNGREHKVILIEVANEYWQNGLDLTELQQYGNYLGQNTPIMIALSSPGGSDCGYPNEPERCIANTYPNNGLIDIATIHFHRTTDWVSVYNCENAYNYINSEYVKISSNEPIGPRYGDDYEPKQNYRIYLVGAAAYAWHCKLPMWVFHATPGVINPLNVSFRTFFSDYVPIPSTTNYFNYNNIFNNLLGIIAVNDLPNWTKVNENDASSPFTGYESTERCTSSLKGDSFITLVLGVYGDDSLTAKRDLKNVTMHQPVTGGSVTIGDLDKNESIDNLCSLVNAPFLILKGVICDKPDSPVIVKPKDYQETNTFKPELLWQAVNMPKHVSLYQAKVFLSDGTPVWEGTTSDTSIQVGTKLACSVTYKWRVRAYNECDWGKWSDFAYFVTPGVPPAPTIISPKNGETTNTRKPVFKWTAPASPRPITDYEIKISGLPSFLVGDGGVTQYKCPYLLDPNTVYSWRIRAQNECGWGPWSSWADFRTPY